MEITPIEQLIIESEKIQINLESETPDDPNQAELRGHELAAIIARTGKILADAKVYKDRALSKSIVRELGKDMTIPASTLNKLVDSACQTENYLFTLAERQNRTATHQLDWIRTVLSKAKEELRLSGGSNNQRRY